MSRIGFIGTGHIAAPIVRHLARKGHRIAVTRRSEAVSTALATELDVTIADAGGVLDQSDIIFLCLRPQHADAVLAPLSFRPDQQIVSVMAGVSAERLAGLCHPATEFVQTIPLGFLQSGGCPLAAYGNDVLLKGLFEPENPVVKVASEDALNAHFATCAMIPGILDLLETGADWLEARTLDPNAAEFYTSQLAAGFLSAIGKDKAGTLARERDALATDGTLSLQMVDSLRGGGAQTALIDALNNIEKRLSPNDD